MLELRGLTKSYGGRLAVAGLDLDIAAGEVLAFLGPNGAGKSTTVRCITGLSKPDSGSVVVDGLDMLTDPSRVRRRIGYVPETAQLHEPLTPSEFLLLKGRLFDLTDDEITDSSARLLSGFGISERADEPMAGFSKGMMQKVSLASALLTRPRLLILDEPLSGLDVETTLMIKELLREFAAGGGSVLYCSHLLDVVQSVAHRIAVLHHGRLLADGSLAELRKTAGAGGNDDLDSVFRQLTKAADPAATAREILGA